MLGVADAFDAMTSARAYRPALAVEEALAELERCAGTQFDPELGAGVRRRLARRARSACRARIVRLAI